MKKSLIFISVLGFSILCITSLTIAAGPTPYDEYKKAMDECEAAVMRIQEFYAGDLINNIKTIKHEYYKVHRSQKGKGEGLMPSKTSKKHAKQFHKTNVAFNKKIKEYQRTCKKAEKILKGGVIMGTK